MEEYARGISDPESCTIDSLAIDASAHPLLLTGYNDILGLALRWACTLFTAHDTFSGGSSGQVSTKLPHGLRWRVASAHPCDVTTIHGMVCELAAFENGLDQVDTSPGTFLSDGFGNGQQFHVLLLEAPTATWADFRKSTEGDSTIFSGAEKDYTPVGMALLHASYSTWKGRTVYLEDLYLQKEARGLKAAGLLFKILSASVLVSKSKRLQFSCLTWNKSAERVYTGIRAEKLEEWRLWRLDERGVADALCLRGDKPPPPT